MAEYILRESVIAEAKHNKAVGMAIADIVDIKEILNNVPAADVEPVRHGKWIYNPNGMDFNLGAWECSVCTQKNNNLPCSRNISPYICVGSKYCPNCGAKMDGE